MTTKYNQTSYDNIDQPPTTDSPYYKTNKNDTGNGPSGSSNMITEITEFSMISESGDFMITEI
jgi:hypothetical protein